MKNLKIFTLVEKSFKQKNRFKGTYLHGKAEQIYQHDIFCFERKQNFKEGVHLLEVNGRDMTFFLWKGTGMEEFRGYLIYSEDTQAHEFCLNHYIKRHQNI
jgi:hypothetical protein